jgi:hypothetical protein
MLANTAPEREMPSSPAWRWFPFAAATWLDPRRLAAVLIALVALAPVFHMLIQSAAAFRNAAYWDEFDTALALLLRLDAGMGVTEFLRELFAVNNEHRMVTSRLLFAASYWISGTINFSVVALIGNSFMVAACGLLVYEAGTAARRLRLGILLAFLLYHFGNYENFLWSGSSIDHFQIVLLAAGCMAGLARGTAAGAVAAGGCALLATYTLAHGIVLWPAGAVLLLAARRRRHATRWVLASVVVIAAYLSGFEANAAHEFSSGTAGGVLNIGWYWLRLAGSALALGNDTAAAVLGAGLIAAVLGQARRGAATREPLAFGLVVFLLGALALIAIGRATASSGIVYSRYFVLSGLAWALTVFIFLERLVPPARFWRSLAWLLPVMAAFNLTANRVFASRFDAWIECRDRALTSYERHGADGRGEFNLHPAPEHATRLLQRAEQQGVFRMGALCRPRRFPDAQPSARIAYFVDDLEAGPRLAFAGGWAAIPGQVARRGQIHVVLRSATATHVFTTVTISRPDVVEATNQPGWQRSGFRFAARRDHLPEGELQLGFLLTGDGPAEYIMTAHRLRLVGNGEALLATGN